MNSKQITFVFFIENHYQEQALINNPLISSNFNVISVFNKAEPKFFDKNILKLETNNFEDSLDNIFKNTKDDWILYLKPEENITFIYNVDELKPSNYEIPVETFVDNNIKSNNFICFETRLFHRDTFKSISENLQETLSIKIMSFIFKFPKIERYHFEQSKYLYNEGIASPSTILYLYKRRFLKKSHSELKEMLNSLDLDKNIKLDIYLEIAKLYKREENLSEAEKILHIAISEFENSVSANYMLGENYYILQNYSGAEKYLKKCIEAGQTGNYYKNLAFPLSLMGYLCYYSLGQTYIKMDDLSKAKESFENSLHIEPDFLPSNESLEKVKKQLQSLKDDPTELQFDCQSCGNCCRGFLINVTNSDVIRILKNRPDLKPDDFILIKDLNENNLNNELFHKSKGKENILILKKQKDSMECIFLDENNLCKINDFKPDLCKVFPFSIRLKDGTLRWNDAHRDFISEFCQHKKRENANDPFILKNNIRQLFENHAVFTELLNEWNKNVQLGINNRNKDEFYNFIFGNYSENNEFIRNKIINLLTDYLKNDEGVKLVIENPFVSIHEDKKEEKIFIAVYIDDLKVNSFSGKENLKKIQEHISAKYIYTNVYPSPYYRFYSDEFMIYLYIYPYKKFNDKLFIESKVIFDTKNEIYNYLSYEELFQEEIKNLSDDFNENLNLARVDINNALFAISNQKLRFIVMRHIHSIIYWANKQNFAPIDLPFLKIKTDDLPEFLVNFSNFLENFYEQTKFADKLEFIYNKILDDLKSDGN